MALSILNVFSICSTAVTAWLLLLVYDAEAQDHIDDPEPEVFWTPPENPEMFQLFDPRANYSGLLYAGSIEFNWIVDIRVQDEDQETWAIGNLVSYLHVVTTSTAVKQLQQNTGTDFKNRITDKDFPQWVVDEFTVDPTLIRVSYCESYLWSEGQFTFRDYTRKTSGSRSVKKIIQHPNYRGKLSFDVAMIVLARSVPPQEPRIGYMPTGFDYVNEKLRPTVILKPNDPITYESPVCYVASYGRNYVNHREFYVIDYKIKFRVYVTHWSRCSDVWDYVCNKDGDQACDDAQIKRSGSNHLLCFTVRAKVGTVCDHDKGAPLVCNGEVVGLVIRGPKWKHCNNLYKIPFIVELLDHYREFFDDSVKYVVKPVPRKLKRDRKPRPVNPQSRASALDVLEILNIAIAWYLFQAVL